MGRHRSFSLPDSRCRSTRPTMLRLGSFAFLVDGPDSVIALTLTCHQPPLEGRETRHAHAVSTARKVWARTLLASRLSLTSQESCTDRRYKPTWCQIGRRPGSRQCPSVRADRGSIQMASRYLPRSSLGSAAQQDSGHSPSPRRSRDIRSGSRPLDFRRQPLSAPGDLAAQQVPAVPSGSTGARFTARAVLDRRHPRATPRR